MLKWIQIDNECESLKNNSHSEEFTNQYGLEVQKIQGNSSTQKNSECEPLLEDSDCVEQDSDLNLYYSAKSSVWDSLLQKQDAVWQNMFEDNPKINLFPICFKYFQRVKSDMDEEVFNQWLKKQKVKYPHRLAYQRMKP